VTFTYFDQTFELFDAPYNDALRNERAVELPIAFDFVERQHGSGLEVGNVLSHYREGSHRIVDRHEVAPGIENLDVFDIDGTYDWIVSVSTLEHVRRDEPIVNRLGGVAALVYLLGLTDRLLVTLGLGQNAALDDYVLRHSSPVRACTLVRDGDGWVQTAEFCSRPYGLTTKWAESVWIGEW
jgi:hypothetical protein